MNVKQLINEVRSNEYLVRQKEEELIRLESLCGVQGIGYEEKISTSHNPNRQEQLYLKLIQFKDDLQAFKQSTIEKRILLEKLVSLISNDNIRNIMYDYCMCNMAKNKIAKKHSYTKRQIYNILNKGMEIMQEELDHCNIVLSNEFIK